MSIKSPDVLGQKFGMLTAVERIKPGEYRDSVRTHWRCTCDCGNETTVEAYALRTSHITSCGCKAGDLFKVSHGMRRTPTYNIWCHMKARCGRETHDDFKHYGGRGITVCDRWMSFENFLADMGETPKGFSIERGDVNGNYEPSNCEWIKAAEQPRNTRRTRYAILNGERMIFSDVARKLGVSSGVPTMWAQGKRRIPSGLDIQFEAA